MATRDKTARVLILITIIIIIGAVTFEGIKIYVEPYSDIPIVHAYKWWGLKKKDVPIRYFDDRIPGYDRGGWATKDSKTEEWYLVVDEGSIYIRW